MQASENSQFNQDYAQEWIIFLKRRNLILTIIWPVLLVLTILASITAFYYSQLQQASELNRVIETEKNHILEDEKQNLLATINALKSSNHTLSAELEELKNAREELSALNTNSTSKLSITSQMVESLNQLVAELKEERDSLNTQLEDSLETITQLKAQHQQYVDQSGKDKSATVAELNKQIASRKSAYTALANRQQDMRQEMDSLRNLINSKDKQIDTLKKDSQNLSQQLNTKNKEISAYKDRVSILEKSYADLEMKLNAMVSPISSAKEKPLDETAQGIQRTDASKKITGLEEIKKPAKQNTQKQHEQSFDHNQISILP